MASHLEVLIAVLKKSFETHLESNYANWMLAHDHLHTPIRKIKKPSIRVIG